MNILIEKRNADGTVTYKKHPLPIKYFSPSKYARDDPIFESHRRKMNNEFLATLENAFEIMEEHARNGFRYMLKREQDELVQRRIKQVVESCKKHGSFYEDELKDLFQKNSSRIDSIYAPNMKWSSERDRIGIVNSYPIYKANALETSRYLPYSPSFIIKCWRNAGLKIGSRGRPKISRKKQISRLFN